MNILSVSSLNEQIKGLLEESFNRVIVDAELSRITYHGSGHIYFTLKDASSSISAVMFRGNASKLKFRLEEGMKVIVDGAITLYKPRGSYQINCFSIEPSGQGALALAFEQLKQKLSSQGYFEPSIKKPLPKFQKKIALITSATGAALQDMLRVANARYRALEIDIYDVLVQGSTASNSISDAIILADTRSYDVIVIGRGGGSIEDLWAFNEEIVADTIFKALTPIVSAVGHEIDWVISDYVADLRAPTPSAAMQMILPDENELYQMLDGISMQFLQLTNQKLVSSKQEVMHLQELYANNSIEKKLKHQMQEVANIKESYNYLINSNINVAQNQLNNLRKMLESNHPKYKTKRGFVQISRDAKVLNISDLEVGDVFQMQSEDICLDAEVIKKEKMI